MVKNVITVYIILFFGVTPLAFSQEKIVLDLEQSVALALQNNPEIQIAEKEVAKAKAGVGEAYATLMPTLDATSAFSHAWDLQRNIIPNFLKPMLAPLAPMIPELALMPDYVEFVFGLENTFTYGLTLTQPLFLGGAGIAGVKMARSGFQASEHRLESKKQNLIYQTSDAFYACLLTQELIQVQEQALRQAQANLNIVLTKYEVGTASGLDKMRAEVEVANLKPVLIGVKNNYRSTLTRLRMVLGLADEAIVEVNGILDFTPDGFGDQSMEDLLSQAYLKRAELAALNSQKRIASGSVALARSQFLPKLFFQTDYSFLAMRNDLKFTQNDFNKGKANMKTGSLIGVLILVLFGLTVIAQEIQHEAVAVNIEVPVRVFDGDIFIDNLVLSDFEIYEEGVLQQAEAVYLIKRTNITREEIIEPKKKETEVYNPETSRYFILCFILTEYIF